MRRLLCTLSICGSLIAAAAADAKVVGSALPDSQGSGLIRFSIDENLNGQDAAEQIADNLALTNGARVESVEVKDCVATIEFAQGAAGDTVQAELPDELAERLGECKLAAAEKAYVPGWPVILGSAAVVGGGIYGGLQASDSDRRTPVGGLSPPPVAPPPVIPPPPPPVAGGPQRPPSGFR